MSANVTQKTLILFKPDAVQRRLCGKLLTRFEEKGLRIAAMKLMKIDDALAAKHYEAHKTKGFYAGLVKFMTSSPVMALVLEGPHAVEVCRNMMGATFGFKAAPGTIRGDFGVSNQYNLIHGSDSPEAAEREIGLFFEPKQVLAWSTADAGLHACD
jgi:nucleoside-diphosphate kinase